MSTATHHLGRTFTIPEPIECQGLRCRRIIAAGDPIAHVTHLARFMRDPGNPDSRAYLCGHCTARMGDRLEVLPDRPPRQSESRTPGPDDF